MSRSTQFLLAAQQGDPQAIQDLFPIVYDQLKSIADSDDQSPSLGNSLTPYGGSILTRVFDGQDVLWLPTTAGYVTKGYVPPEKLTKPGLAVIVPIDSPTDPSRPIGCMMVSGRGMQRQFEAMIGTAWFGETGESYAIDRRGYLITESRFLDQLQDAEMIPKGPDAWHWIDEYDFGVIAEVDHDVAFAPLKPLNQAYAWLLGLVFLTTLGLTGTSLALVRARRTAGMATRIGPYHIEKQIGEGGLAQVFLATHTLLRRPTALKLLKLDQVNPKNLDRFEREIQIASSLCHPNTIEIYDFGKTSDGAFYSAWNTSMD